MVSCAKTRSPPTSPPLQLHDYHLDHIPRRHQQNEISKQECQAICVFLVHTLPRVVLLWIELDTVTKFHFCLVSSWSNIFSKVKSIFCPDQELGVQPKRNDKHLFLPGQPQHPRQQVKDPSKMLGFSISHFHTHSSLNFFIYCFASEGFRSSFKDLVRTRCWWRGRPFKRQPSATSEITEI